MVSYYGYISVKLRQFVKSYTTQNDYQVNHVLVDKGDSYMV